MATRLWCFMRRAAFSAGIALGTATCSFGQMYGGPGMMGPGMMQGGAPPNSGSFEEGPPIDRTRASALVGYITEHRLSCMQCHSVADGGYGPPFALIAENAAQAGRSAQSLADSIVQGFGRMPGGLADPAQAMQLARLILALAHK